MHQVINAQFLQLQHDGAEIGPQDLWICVVLRHYRDTRAAQGTIYNESVTVLAYYLLMHQSYVNLNRNRESRASEELVKNISPHATESYIQEWGCFSEKLGHEVALSVNTV